jgi:nucleoid DNA-binding protein
MIQNLIDLIKEDGRVIIPGFGCFSKNENDAIVLNTFLKFNDGKLVKSLIDSGSNSEEEALKSIEKWVSQVTEQVEKNRSFQLESLGVLLFDKFGDFILTPTVAGAKPVTEEVAKPTTVEVPTDDHDVSYEGFNDEGQQQSESAKEEDLPEINEQPEPEIIAEIIEPENVVTDSILENEIQEAESGDEISKEINTEELPVENSTTTKEPKAKKEKKTKEVKVKKKRGAFFYINIILLFLILSLGGISFFFMDEVSTFLGIKHEETQVPADSLEASDLEIEDKDPEINEETLVENESQDTIPSEENSATPESRNQSTPVPQPDPQPSMPQDIPAVASVGNFHIVVGKFAVKENADRLVAKIRAAGYDGKILRSTSTGHTVSFHTYPTFQDAKNQIEKAKEISGTKAYVFKP